MFPYRYTIAPLTNDTEDKFFRDIITYINTPITSWNTHVAIHCLRFCLPYEVHTRSFSRFH